MTDQFVECELCESKLCYHLDYSETEYSKTCFSCGMSTNTHMKKGSELDKKTLNTTPELYKDLRTVDKSGLVWYPATITLPEKGMVFLDGTSKEDIGWAAVKLTLIKNGERSKFPVGQSHKLDMTTYVKFDKDQFTEAANSIGFFG